MANINKRKKARNYVMTGISLIALALLLYMANSGLWFSSYVVRIMRLCGVYAIASLSLTLISGLTGQFSLGQAGFMAIGAYVTTLLILSPEAKESMFYITPIVPWLRDLHMPFLPALLLGGILSALFAFLIGFPVLRLKSDYLAIATLGFSEIIRIIITNATSITNSSAGIRAIPDTANIWWTTITAGICVFSLLRLMKTSYGRAFKAIRDDEVAAESIGVSLFKHKMLSFIISAFLAGISGGLMASVVGVLTPIFFRFTLTYEILLIVVLGGQGSISGTVVASVIITVARELLRFLDEGFNIGPLQVPAIPGMRMLVFSVFLMVIILFYRDGLFGSREFSWDMVFDFFGGLGKRVKKLFSKLKVKGGEKT